MRHVIRFGRGEVLNSEIIEVEIPDDKRTKVYQIELIVKDKKLYVDVRPKDTYYQSDFNSLTVSIDNKIIPNNEPLISNLNSALSETESAAKIIKKVLETFEKKEVE